MKKKIANGVELLLLVISFIMLWIPCIKIQYVEMLRDLPISTHAVGIMEKTNAYMVFAIYAITAVMCIISIVVKAEHRDGKMHVIMPVVLFFYAVAMLNVEVGKVIGEWEIVESKFPVPVFLACLFGAIAISIIKRSTIITGLPSSKNKKADTPEKQDNAGELKKYKELLDSGAITQEEFDEKKKQLLNL